MPKLRVTFSTLFVSLLLLIEYRFFYLIPWPDSIQKAMTYHNKTILFLCSFLFLLLYRQARKKLLLKSYVYIFMLIVSLSLVYSLIYFRGSMLDESLFPYIAYMTIFLYFPLRKYLAKNLSQFFFLLTLFNIIACVTLLLQAVSYYYGHHIFMSIYEFSRSGRTFVRNGGIRITYSGTLISLSCIVSQGLLLTKGTKHRLIHWANFFLSLAYFQLVSQTRAYVVVLILTFILLIWANGGNRTKSWIIRLLFYNTVFVLILYSGVAQMIIDFIRPIFDGGYIQEGSYYARLESIEYCFSILRSKPLTGMGLLNPETTSQYYYIVHSATGRVFFTDIGILGSTARFGLPVLIWYIFLLRRLRRLAKKHHDGLLLGFYYFLIFSSLTLSVLDPQRIPFLAITLAIFEARVQATSYEEKPSL